MRTQDRDVKGIGRVVHGRVSSSGGIVAGSGFTVTSPSAGTYVITFLEPFRTVPEVFVQIVDMSSPYNFVSRVDSNATTNSQAQIETLQATTGGVAQAFEFIAIEGSA